MIVRGKKAAVIAINLYRIHLGAIMVESDQILESSQWARKKDRDDSCLFPSDGHIYESYSAIES